MTLFRPEHGCRLEWSSSYLSYLGPQLCEGTLVEIKAKPIDLFCRYFLWCDDEIKLEENFMCIQLLYAITHL